MRMTAEVLHAVTFVPAVQYKTKPHLFLLFHNKWEEILRL